MTRKALIISNPGEVGAENYCEGVKKDVINYKDFLMSPQGGYWYENEVVCLEKPSETLLNLHLSLCEDVDYSMIIFCGHGYSCNGETILELDKDIELNENVLRQGAKKRTIILDCCRKNVEVITESVAHSYFSKIEKRAINGMDARKFYDELILECSNDVVVTYACDLDEKAGEDSRYGGYYSFSLLKSARTWFEETHCYKEYKSIVAIHERASELTKEKSGYKQNPKIAKPRSLPYFPFVVSV